ncbi:immunity 49 family protein [Streptomyces sp. NBC_00091]|uniref:immunity 49 family protein n=1 Tax=Streptomyces sp. NBC_00091 TaxID=2975648 RepID=UPI002256B946|nr:immunity 49 family protein [Streptomyces sp. NBC_00091]MCX5376743.1 immunity 49 family protein [Streptomyces sp. NBC_00091]
MQDVREVERHRVREARIAGALDDIRHRTWMRYDGMYSDPAPERLRDMCDELLDHVAARTTEGGRLGQTARTALHTAAQCAMGVLSIGCFPGGDQEVQLPLVSETVSSEDFDFTTVITVAPTARTWLDAFETTVVSGLVWDWQKVIGLLLRDDYAPAVRDGVPYSPYTPHSEPADLAAMDALCGYLTESAGHLPSGWPTVPLCKPDAAARAEAARRLDAAGPLTADQRLLRVLLNDDRAAFEAALADRLTAHRESAEAEADPAPRTLLPLGPLALAALAVQTHQWELGVRSGYLPPELLGFTDAMRLAGQTQVNGLGGWVAAG